jgi:hypothetical protein
VAATRALLQPGAALSRGQDLNLRLLLQSLSEPAVLVQLAEDASGDADAADDVLALVSALLHRTEKHCVSTFIMTNHNNRCS